MCKVTFIYGHEIMCFYPISLLLTPKYLQFYDEKQEHIFLTSKIKDLKIEGVTL